MRKQTVNRRVFFRSAAGAILALVLVGGMASSASAQAVLQGVVNGSTLDYNGGSYPIVGGKATIDAKVYWVGPAGYLIYCDTCTAALGGTPGTGGTTGGATGCPTAPPADRSYVTVSGTSVTYGGCTYPLAGSNVTILGSTYLVGPGGVLIRLSASGGSTTTTCPSTPPADRSTVTVSGTNVLYGGCTYAMAGSNVTILGNTYVVGPGGVLILSAPPPAACPTAPPANGATVSVSGTNVVYGGCSYVMSGPVNVTILGKAYLVVSNRYLILTTPPSTGGSTPPSTGGTTPPSTGGSTGGPEPSAGTWGTPFQVMSAPGGYIYKYDVAYDGQSQRFLVVVRSSYGGYDPAWGQFVNAAGAKVGTPFLISAGKTAFEPRVAASGDGVFLVSYGSGSDWIVQTVRYAGAPIVGPPITVDTGISPWSSGVAWMPQAQRFMVTWTKNSSSAPNEREVWAMPVTREGGLATGHRITFPNADQLSPLGTPEIAVGADGSMMVVGYRDCTGVAWAGKCGIYSTRIDASGVPISPTENLIYGSWSRFPKVVFNSASNVYQVAWITYTSTGGQVLGMRFNLNGSPIDSEPYTIKATSRSNSYYGDDTFGEVGLAYEPVSGTYLLAFRGQDPGNGTAPIWRMVADSEGQGANSSLWEVSNATKSPEPVIISDGNGNATIFYRGGWSDIFAVKVTK